MSHHPAYRILTLPFELAIVGGVLGIVGTMIVVTAVRQRRRG